jgi:hypothetical protein
MFYQRIMRGNDQQAGGPIINSQEPLCPMYDSVGIVKALFQVFVRKKSIEYRLFGKDGVKGAYSAFILTLDTVLPKPTIGAGRNLRRSF